MSNIAIGICGLGFVGTAIYNSFIKNKVSVIAYDKYKPEKSSTIEELLDTSFIILCLPTQYCSNTKHYDLSAIYDTCQFLTDNNYTGGVVIKSTVVPGTTDKLTDEYSTLNFIHNPEFLTARTADHDYLNQTHIVLGRGESCSNVIYQKVVDFHKTIFPEAEISQCSSAESEAMKIVANCFYSVKIQYFTEVYLLCTKLNLDYNLVKSMVIKNGWVNPMHTNIPGPDGEISYGGLCFPKDTNAFLEFLKSNNIPHKLIESVVTERDSMRSDQDNIL